MAFKTFSPRQRQALTWWAPASGQAHHTAVICDGAVRSGKTVCLSLSFVAWSMCHFTGQNFGLCGKTIAALRRNVIGPLLGHLNAIGFECDYKISQNYLDIGVRQGRAAGRRQNRYYLFSGKDEASAARIQGVTLAGVLFDEVALMPRAFVEQALARCSVEGSRFWFNCNPESPYHWFYREWIEKRAEKNALYLHFTMDDNPGLSQSMRARYQSLYSGRFYERFVLGKWVAQSGLVYLLFDPALHVVSPPPQEHMEAFYLSCDYGTVNPASFGLWGRYTTEGQERWHRIAEYYHDSAATGIQLTDEEYYAALEGLAGGRAVVGVVVDPSAASFMETIRRHGKYRVIAARNAVEDGIRCVSDALRQKRIAFAPCCRDSIREFSLYRWDDKSPGDRPVKEHDHAMDDIRYFVYTVLYRAEEGEQFAALSVGRH